MPSPETVRAEKARRRLTDYCRYVDDSYVVAEPHRRLLAALEAVERGDCHRLIVQMPPRIGKSLTTSIRFPAWFLGRDPDRKVLLGSYSADLAYDFSRRCRNELREHGQGLFGIELADDSAAVSRWGINGREGYFAAAGVGGPFTGRGGDLLVIDDPVKGAEQADSELYREKVKSWYRSDARTRLHPGGRVVVVQTRWHEDDLAGWLQDEARKGSGERFEVLSLPMLSEADEPLWPERYDAEECGRIKLAVGSRAWEALYQQRPAPDGGAILKREWWKRYRELPPVMDEVVLSIDATFKDKDSSDFVVIQAWGRLGTRKYLLDQRRARMGFSQTCQAIRDFRAALVDRRLKPDSVLIEDKANGSAIIETLRHERTGIDGVIAVEPKGGKVARARNVEAQVEAGQVFLPDEAPWVGDFIEECAAFPNGKHDDQVDAMTQALVRLSSSDGDGWVPTIPGQQAEQRTGTTPRTSGWVSRDVEM